MYNSDNKLVEILKCVVGNSSFFLIFLDSYFSDALSGSFWLPTSIEKWDTDTVTAYLNERLTL